MAITASGWYVQNLLDALDPTQLALDLTLATSRISLMSDAATPNFDTDVTWNATNEVAGTGWATPGVLLSAAAAGATSTAPTLTISPTGTMMWDMGDISVASTTLTNAMCARIYQDALAGDNLIILVDFVSAFSTVNGTFGIAWSSLGVGVVDWTP